MLYFVQAVPIERPNPRHNEKTPRNPDCGFVGNCDIYGLGIRLGLYMQWPSAYFTSTLLPEAIADLAGVTFIFEFALVVAAAVLTKGTSDICSIEVMILIAMLLGDMWLVHVPIGYAPSQRPTSTTLGVLAGSLVIIAIAAFAL
jgi:hypothetical protein